MAVEVHYEPADGDGPAGEGAHGDEVDAAVLGGEGVVDGDEDGEAGDREEGAEGEVWGAEAGAIGEVGDYDREGERGGDGRDGVQLGLHGGVAEGGFDDCWGEVCEA